MRFIDVVIVLFLSFVLPVLGASPSPSPSPGGCRWKCPPLGPSGSELTGSRYTPFDLFCNYLPKGNNVSCSYNSATGLLDGPQGVGCPSTALSNPGGCPSRRRNIQNSEIQKRQVQAARATRKRGESREERMERKRGMIKRKVVL